VGTTVFRRLFGTTNNADADGDGWNNWHEYRLGTDPTNAQSRFAITNMTAAGDSGQFILC